MGPHASISSAHHGVLLDRLRVTLVSGAAGYAR
jgi:hypothetical protein